MMLANEHKLASMIRYRKSTLPEVPRVGKGKEGDVLRLMLNQQ